MFNWNDARPGIPIYFYMMTRLPYYYYTTVLLYYDISILLYYCIAMYDLKSYSPKS